MAKINLRSPYFVTVTATDLTQADLELYVYGGTQVTDRSVAKYIIQTPAYNNVVTFEISELCKDFLTASNEVLWVDYRVKQYISGVPSSYGSFVLLTAFNGYGYFEEGVNPTNTKMGLISNSTILVLKDDTVRMPVDASLATSVQYLSNGSVMETDIISPSTASSSQVVESNTALNDIDSIVVLGSLSSEIFTVKQIEECVNEPYRIRFTNKFGVNQDVYFFKKSILSTTIKDEKYKSNILTYGSYNITGRQNKILSKQGSDRITLNSGFYPEENNEMFRQLLLSENVWIGSNLLPVNIITSSFQFKTQLNDKLINYTIDFEYAFDKINNIR